MSHIDKIKEILKDSIDIKYKILQDEIFLDKIEKTAHMIIDSFNKGNKLFICGNGGSAADAQHIAAEFSGRFYKERKPLPAEAIHVNTSYLTAVANDYGYENVFSRFLLAFGRENDILWGLSTSGKSVNVLNAFKTAYNLKMKTIAFVGKDIEHLPEFIDIVISIPSNITPRIQECHITIAHIICEIVDIYFT